MSKFARKGNSAAPKRKRAEVASDSEDSLDLDTLLPEGDDDGSDFDASDAELEMSVEEVKQMRALMQQQAKKGKKQKKAAAVQEESEEEEEDMDDMDDDMEEEDGEGSFIGGDSSSDDGEEYADEGTGAIARPAKKQKVAKTYLNNKAALEDKLADIRLPTSYPWIETLALNTNKSFAQATDEDSDAVHDDLKREAAFYELTLAAASEGLARLTDLNIPFRIPIDFFAERVKPDKHMARIKDKLLEEKRKMETVAERKQHKESRKYAKQVQSNKIQEKAKEKKANTEAASKLRKQSKEDGQELGVERSILPGIQEHLAANRAEEQKRREKKSAKREAKDKKYGHGGKKRGTKRNDRDSSASGKFDLGQMRSNFSGFSDSKPGSTHERRANSNKGGPQKNKNGSAFTMGKSMRGGAAAGRGGRGGRGGGRGGKPNRPGKSARASGRK